MGGLFAGSLCIVLAFSLAGAGIAVLVIREIVPKFSLLETSVLLSMIVILLVVGITLNGLMDATLMAFRKGHYILVRSVIVNGPRVCLLLIVVGLGLRGILGVYTIMLVVGVMYSISISVWRLMRFESFRPTLGEIRKHLHFAAANYFGGMFGVLPGTLLPIIVLAKVGASDAAFFYMPMQIAVFLNLITSSTAQALVAEASQTDNASAQRKDFEKAVAHLFQLLVPAALLLSTAGWAILWLYGSAYVENGYSVLVLLCIASMFVGLNWLGETWLNVEKRSRAYFIMNGLTALCVVAGAYGLSSYGLIGVAAGWLVGECVCSAIYVTVFPSMRSGFVAGLYKMRHV